jgi:Rrf2 family protein
MRYAQSTELAVDSLLFMAAHDDRQEFSAEELATAQNLSVSYLAKIMQQLARAGLLRSQRGPKGGYALARLPREISLLDIAQVFEGSAPLYSCNAQAKLCSLGSHCLIVSTFRDAESKMRDVLRGVTLADLLSKLQEHATEASWVKSGAAS